MMELCGSSPVYSLLKRVDEKFVTEKAYENPKFVEDIVREATEKMMADERITWFSVEAENFESIHKHSAYACIERDKNR
jgi:GTP cyclohydrolase I